jgi:hypothetical protein
VTHRIRAFLLVEVVAFAAAVLVHFGLLVDGYEYRQARVAESVITLGLLVGLVLSWLRPTWTREAGLVAQGFALLGTLVGLLVAVRSPANYTSQPREVGS